MGVRIAVDAMGGDHAPREIVLGALKAIEEDPDIHVVLVGREEAVRAELPEGHDARRVSIVHATEVIECSESPADGLRRKKDSTVVRGLRLVSEGGADAFVGAGSTGAVVGGATLFWRLIPGVLKAGIAVTIKQKTGYTLLMDVGANVSCKPVHLLHYGMLASIYAERVLDVAKPRVGLLNIGSEEAKGNDLVKETRELFAHAPFNFVGHVEGNDLFNHTADVVVCEGFVGNVVLKVIEGFAESLHSKLEEMVGEVIDVGDGAVRVLIDRFKKIGDYAEVGGAPLLGVNGTCLICHGRSDRRAISNAVKLAARYVRSRALATMADGLKTYQAT